MHTESRTLHCLCINDPHVFLLPPAYAQFTAYLLALPLFRAAFFGVDRIVRYYVLLFRPPSRRLLVKAFPICLVPYSSPSRLPTSSFASYLFGTAFSLLFTRSLVFRSHILGSPHRLTSRSLLHASHSLCTSCPTIYLHTHTIRTPLQPATRGIYGYYSTLHERGFA